jgi:hypothetical protein
MGALLPFFNMVRALFGYEKLVNYSAPSLQGRNIVILQSDFDRISAAITKESKITDIFERVFNNRLNIQERKAACDELDLEDLELKTSLLESIGNLRPLLKDLL